MQVEKRPLLYSLHVFWLAGMKPLTALEFEDGKDRPRPSRGLEQQLEAGIHDAIGFHVGMIVGSSSQALE
jgi:hypothetical protein